MSNPAQDQAPPPLDPTPLMRLSTAYWDSQTFLTANRIGLFDALSGGEQSLASLASTLGIAERPARLFLNACIALELVECVDGRYRNAPTSEAFLVSGRPGFLGNAFRYSDDLYGSWGQLEQTLRSDMPALAEESYLGDDEERTRNFVYGMHDRATGIGRALVGLYDLSGRKAMLDVGGGPGTYSAFFTERFAGLNSQLLDLPDVVAIAREIINFLGAAERVSTLPGDYHTTAFPKGKDVVLISGVFHRESEAGCRDLIARAGESLVPGGVLLINDVFTSSQGGDQLFATLFGLNMLLTAPNGGVHEDKEVAEWMRTSGFDDVEIKAFPPPMPHRLVAGIKK